MVPPAKLATLKTPAARPAHFGFTSTALLAGAIAFVTLAASRPVVAQGLVTFAQQSAARPNASTTVASLSTFGATFSAASTSSAYRAQNSADEFSFHTTAIYPAQSFGSLLPIQETKTPFISELRVPLAQLYGSRVRLGFYVLTVQNGNMTLGPLATIQALHSPSLPRSVNLYGIGLSIPLGKESHPEISKNLWSTAERLIRDR